MHISFDKKFSLMVLHNGDTGGCGTTVCGVVGVIQWCGGFYTVCGEVDVAQW